MSSCWVDEKFETKGVTIRMIINLVFKKPKKKKIAIYIYIYYIYN